MRRSHLSKGVFAPEVFATVHGGDAEGDGAALGDYCDGGLAVEPAGGGESHVAECLAAAVDRGVGVEAGGFR